MPYSESDTYPSILPPETRLRDTADFSYYIVRYEITTVAGPNRSRSMHFNTYVRIYAYIRQNDRKILSFNRLIYFRRWNVRCRTHIKCIRHLQKGRDRLYYYTSAIRRGGSDTFTFARTSVKANSASIPSFHAHYILYVSLVVFKFQKYFIPAPRNNSERRSYNEASK